MIGPGAFLHLLIDPGTRLLSHVTGQGMAGDPAAVLLLAIALQESGLEHRRQVDAAGNPIDKLARSWWQMEAGGGVHGVMTHAASTAYAEDVCDRMYVPFVQDDIHEAIAWNGYLALAFARLLLWTDAAPLPKFGDEQGAWDYYLRLWRPGRPHPEIWPSNYQLGYEAVAAASAPPPETA